MIDRLEQMEQRYNDLQAQFSLPEVINDHEKYQKTAKTLREIETPVEKYRELKQVQRGLAEARAMVAGVFTARWTIPTLIKGTRQVFADLAEHKHLIPFAILAGMLWAVANTLTVFAIRDVGLAIAFPLWNTNSLVGILWGRLLFGELKGASRKNVAKVVLGALAIVAAAIMGLEDGALRSRDVVFRCSCDLIEKLGTGCVIKQPRGKPFGPG